jgi:hypothetical protein
MPCGRSFLAATPGGGAWVEGVTRTYSGTRRTNGTTFVNVNGRPLDARSGLRSDSATTFDWGYGGRGAPAQLALAILADHFADDEQARRHYERFLRSVVRKLPSDSWILTGPEIDDALPDSRHSGDWS